MDVRSLPLYNKVQEALVEQSFMHNGGYLGIYCQHAYAHSTPEGSSAIPSVLKGSDMVIYSIFLALGLQVSVHPILDHKCDYEYRYLKECHDRCETEDEETRSFFTHNYVGKKLEEVVVTEAGGYEESYKEIARLSYGNEPGINTLYTHAALLVALPPASERTSKATA
ncbi:hypothetical protein K469DRAFT_692973 [Zopfia rhizophila CBS 207.26]|uniref:Uncharacterized protein n=1 Tax=Zopfia rhizophila CBS 207.26 TaxID=1314779 RepID=A0A6A6EMQ5_9PEZI|nr:hypothetical protein K469DRAFT_692973 [Zopfia rhizophila CBS 207.26]